MSYLDKVVESLIPKQKITLVRLNEQGEELPSNIQPETAGDLIAFSVRDLKSTLSDLRGSLEQMRQTTKDERQIVALEQETDMISASIARLERAAELMRNEIR
jgi:hypothetical protein